MFVCVLLWVCVCVFVFLCFQFLWFHVFVFMFVFLCVCVCVCVCESDSVSKSLQRNVLFLFSSRNQYLQNKTRGGRTCHLFQVMQGVAAGTKVCYQRRHFGIPGEAQSDQLCVPAQKCFNCCTSCYHTLFPSSIFPMFIFSQLFTTRSEPISFSGSEPLLLLTEYTHSGIFLSFA